MDTAIPSGRAGTRVEGEFPRTFHRAQRTVPCRVRRCAFRLCEGRVHVVVVPPTGTADPFARAMPPQPVRRRRIGRGLDETAQQRDRVAGDGRASRPRCRYGARGVRTGRRPRARAMAGGRRRETTATARPFGASARHRRTLRSPDSTRFRQYLNHYQRACHCSRMAFSTSPVMCARRPISTPASRAEPALSFRPKRSACDEAPPLSVATYGYQSRRSPKP